MGSWIEKTRLTLVDLQSRAGGWSYRRGAPAAVEPSALAALALLATDDPQGASRQKVKRAAGWLANLQQKDGSLGPNADLTRPAWPTTLGLLLWAQIEGFSDQSKRATNFLLRRRGRSFENKNSAVVGHDLSLVGWPWVDDTHSWLEPTAMAVLALRVAKQATHRRAKDGLKLIRDRAVPGGGWNWGNSTVFDRAQRPQPDTTGLALLALRSTEKDRVVQEGLGYLKKRLPAIQATRSLCWGTLALEAWGERTNPGSLEQAHQLLPKPAAPQRLAELLLAAGGPRTLGLLGVEEPT